MSDATLIITKVEVKEEGLLISEMKVIDKKTGTELKIAKLTPELCEYLKCIEIDPMGYFLVKDMQKKNPTFKKLVSDFDLQAVTNGISKL